MLNKYGKTTNLVKCLHDEFKINSISPCLLLFQPTVYFLNLCIGRIKHWHQHTCAADPLGSVCRCALVNINIQHEAHVSGCGAVLVLQWYWHRVKRLFVVCLFALKVCVSVCICECSGEDMFPVQGKHLTYRCISLVSVILLHLFSSTASHLATYCIQCLYMCVCGLSPTG